MVDNNMSYGWIGVDLDGTLAEYDGWHGSTHIGTPIPKMLRRVKEWINQGKDVRIFTARASDPEAKTAIILWCCQHIGKVLPITNVKDLNMIELWDDRCVQIIANTGKRADGILD